MGVFRTVARPVQLQQFPKLVPAAPLTDIFFAGHSLSASNEQASSSLDLALAGHSFSASNEQASGNLETALAGHSLSASEQIAQLGRLLPFSGHSSSASEQIAQLGRLYSLAGHSRNVSEQTAETFSILALLLRREFKVLMRVSTHNYGTIEAYRAAVWHEPLMVDVPEPSEGLRDSFGIQSGDTLEVNIADTALRAVLEGGTLDGAQALLEWITTDFYSDNTSVDNIFSRMYTVKAYGYKPGLVSLKLVDLEDARLTALYPTKLYNATDWPQIFQDHVGRAVPIAVGTAIKIPCSLIHTNAGAGPWKFAVCVSPATVLTVYRDGRIVPTSEYTVGTLATIPGGYTVVTLTFTAEQVDFAGNLYPIEADVTGLSGNAVTELKRLLQAAGVSIDTATFAAGETYAAANKMQVDFGHTIQRFYSAIIYDLLQVCRASLVRNAAGAYELIQDTAQAVVYTYDERAGDLIQVTDYQSADAPLNHELAYRPRENEFQYTVKRNAGGFIGTQELQTSLVRDHEAADRISDYLSKRLKYGATARALLVAVQVKLGQVLAITSDNYWTGTKQFKISGIRRSSLSNEVDLIEYNSAIYTYAAQAFPADATTGYSPDYSGTPPAVPTSVGVVSQGVALNEDGVAQSYIKLRAIPPAINWATIYFQATNTATNEIYQGIGANNGDGTWGLTLAGLRPNTAHTYEAWAVNKFGVKGIVSTPASFTSQAWTSAPAIPGGVVVAQGVGKIARLRWAKVAGKNIAGYEIEKKIGAGAFAYLDTVKATGYTDINVSYGTLYSYRLRAEDYAGNFSAYSATVTLTPAVNVNTADIVTSAVTTGTINPNAVTSSSTSTTTPADPGTALVSGGWTTMDAIVKTVTGERVVIEFVVLVDLVAAPVSYASFGARVLRGTTVLQSFIEVATISTGNGGTTTTKLRIPYSDSMEDNPAAGTYTYYLQLRGEENLAANTEHYIRGVFTVSEFKR